MRGQASTSGEEGGRKWPTNTWRWPACQFELTTGPSEHSNSTLSQDEERQQSPDEVPAHAHCWSRTIPHRLFEVIMSPELSVLAPDDRGHDRYTESPRPTPMTMADIDAMQQEAAERWREKYPTLESNTPSITLGAKTTSSSNVQCDPGTTKGPCNHV